MDKTLQIVCASCHAINRVPYSRLSDQGKCGKCKTALISSDPINLSDDVIKKHISKNDLPVVIDFWADWCGPCKMFAPIFAATAAKFSEQARFIKIDTEKNPIAGSMYQIRSIPTLMVFKNGVEVTRKSGAMNQVQFESWLHHHQVI